MIPVLTTSITREIVEISIHTTAQHLGCVSAIVDQWPLMNSHILAEILRNIICGVYKTVPKNKFWIIER